MHKIIKSKLHSEVEGTCSGRYGHIIAVSNIDDVGRGVISDNKVCLYKNIFWCIYSNCVIDCVYIYIYVVYMYVYVVVLYVYMSHVPEDMVI